MLVAPAGPKRWWVAVVAVVVLSLLIFFLFLLLLLLLFVVVKCVACRSGAVLESTAATDRYQSAKNDTISTVSW